MNVTFDWNEWFSIFTSLVAFCLFLSIRKYFPLVFVILVWMYNIGLVSTIDYFLVATPFKVYYFGDNATYDFFSALFHLFVYPCASLIFLYIYDKWELHGKKTKWYILFWTIFAVFF